METLFQNISTVASELDVTLVCLLHPLVQIYYHEQNFVLYKYVSTSVHCRKWSGIEHQEYFGQRYVDRQTNSGTLNSFVCISMMDISQHSNSVLQVAGVKVVAYSVMYFC